MLKLKYIFLLIRLASSSWGYAQDQHIIDSLKTRLEMDIHDTDRVKTINELAWYSMYEHTDSSVALSEEALELSSRCNWRKGIAESLGQIGTFYDLKGEYWKSIKYSVEALRYSRRIDNTRLESVFLGNIATVYDEQANYPKALEYYFEALLINKKNSNFRGCAIKLGNIAIVYFNLNNFEQSINYSRQAISILETLDEPRISAIFSMNLAGSYEALGKYDSAFYYSKKAYTILDSLGDMQGSVGALFNLGTILTATQEYNRAEHYLIKADSLICAANLTNSKAKLNEGFARLYLYTNRLKESLQFISEAINASLLIGNPDLVQHQLLLRSEIYTAMDQPAKAFEAYKLHIIYRDSITNEENTKAQTRTEMNYEYEKAELVKQQKEAETLRNEHEETARRDNLQYSVILISLLLVFGGVLSLGFIKVSPKVAEGLIFFSFLILFEFILVLADPYVDQYSGGAPGYKLLFNAVLAGMIFPLHAWFERVLKMRLIKAKRNE